MFQTKPTVAVLLAAYNGMAYIEEQVNTILAQVDVEPHIFISVDVSDDGTYEWCCQLEKKHQPVTVLPYGERYGGAAANFFRLINDVDFTAYNYVALADQDDIWLQDKLITGCARLTESSADAYSGNVLAFWETGEEQLIDKAQPLRRYDYCFEAAGPGCTYIFTSESLLEFKNKLQSHKQLIKSISLHDWLVYAFYRASGYKWIFDSDYKMRYRQHHSNQVGVNTGLQAKIKRMRLFATGWYRGQVGYISQFIGLTTPDFTSHWQVVKNIKEVRRKRSERVVLFFMVIFGLY